MGNRLTDTIRGIVCNSQRWVPENLSANDAAALNSDYTELDPRPGTMTTTDARARLRPQVSNAQVGGSLLLKVTDGGLPGPEGAAMSYRLDKEAADAERGWNQPNLLAGWPVQEWSDTLVYDDMDCVTIPSTQQVVGFAQDGSVAATTARARVFDPEDWTWTAGALVPWGINSREQVVALAYLPGVDRVIAIVMTTVGNPMQVWATEDLGVTWEEYSLKPIRDPTTDVSGPGFGAGISRGRAAAQRDGSVLATLQPLISGGTENVAQLASSDLGVTFTLVETAAALGTNVDVFALPDGTYAVTFIAITTGFPRIRILGSAFDPISTATEVGIGSVPLVSMTATVDADGTIYVFGGRDTTFSKIFVWKSADYGRTWTEFDWGLVDTGDLSAYPILFSSCATAGYILIQHQWTASVGNEDGSVGVMLAAGWSNLSAVDDGFFRNFNGDPTDGPRQFERFSYGAKTGIESNTWLPIERPSDTIYTAAGGLGVLEAPGVLNMTSVGAGVDSMTFTTTTGIVDCVVLMEMDCTVLGSQVAMVVGADIEVSDPGVPVSYNIQIRVSTTGFAVHNVHGANIGTVAIDMITSPLQIVVHLFFDSTGTVGRLRTYYRRRGATVWTAGPQGDTIAKAAAAANLSQVIFCHHAVTTSVSYWTQFNWAFEGGVAFGADMVDGKRIADLPYPLIAMGNTTTDDKAFVALRGGPGTRGEVYTVIAEADFGVYNVFPTASPSRDRVWQTVDTTTARVSVDMVEFTRVGNSWALVIGVLNANVRQLTILASVGGVPSTLGTWDGAVGFTALDYILDGDTLHPDVATTPGAGRWLQANEMAGGHVVLPGGKARTILSNSAGYWGQNTTVLPHIRLEGIDGTEAATGAVDICAPSGFIVFHLAEVFYKDFQVQIGAAQATASGKYSVGNLLVGSLTVPGKQWSAGWSLGYAPNYSATVDPHGTEYRQQRGPEQRSYSFAFPDGVKFHDLRGASPDPNYIASTVGLPLAAKDDVLGNLVALLIESKGFTSPCMLLAEVPDANAVTVTDPTLWVYGLLTGSIQADNVLGNENSNEFYRVSGLVLTEVR